MSSTAQTIHGVGERIESMVASAKNEIVIHSSQKDALFQGARQVEPLMAHVDAEVEKGTFDIATATHIKKYVHRAILQLEGMGKRAENSALEAAGRLRGVNDCVAVVKKLYDAHVAEEILDQQERERLLAAAGAAEAGSEPEEANPEPEQAEAEPEPERPTRKSRKPRS